MDTARLGKRNPLEMLYLNRKFVCPAETAHDVGKIDGGEESEQVKDDHPLLPVAQPLPPPAEFCCMSVFLRSERVEDLFIPLSFILSDVPVFDDGKTLYQKALRIVVAPGYIPQTAGGDKRPFGNAARTDDVLPAIGLHLVWITVEVPLYAVHRQRLRDVSRYHPVEVAFLLQVPVVTDGTFIREVKGTLDVAFNGALVR